jgi:hypothetical protein
MPNNTLSYYELNKDRVKAKQKEYREKNREKIAEYKHQHYLDNKEHFLTKQRNYYEQNKFIIFAKNRDRGNCAFCSKELSRNSIYRHIASFHQQERQEMEELQISNALSLPCL